MFRVNRCMALVVVVVANVGVSSAENHPAAFGQYSTAVNESRLFVKDNALTTLRCDLFFSATGSNQTIVAPKGSVVSQTVPAFVWQYSGLLPVTDYLKTVAIHSASSEIKENSWQDVQLAFYKGLRVEGARDSDAKIAYAGAYAFAPRWPLVELVELTDPQQDKSSKLYKIEYTPAGNKGVSVSDYRILAQDILAAPESVSLQDIRGVIDAADAAKTTDDSDSAIKKLFTSDKVSEKISESSEAVQQPMMMKDKEASTDTAIDGLFVDDGNLPDAITEPYIDEVSDEPAMVVESVEVMVPKMVEQPKPEQPEEQPVVMKEVGEAILGPEDPVTIVVEGDTDKSSALMIDTNAGAQPGVWKTLPDGSVILMNIE